MNNGAAVKFGNLDDWRTDPDKVRNGVPFDLGQGRTLLVRRANLYDRELQAHFEQIDSKDTAAVQAVFARHLVAGWSGIRDADGNDIPFTVDNCLALFAFAPDVWEQLQRFAMNRANYGVNKAQGDVDAVKPLRDGEPVQAPTANS